MRRSCIRRFYHGHVSGGVIVLDDPVRLPDGVQVTIRPEESPPRRDPAGIAGSWADDRTAEEIIKDIHSHRSRRSKR
jgi:hypothetical protein